MNLAEFRAMWEGDGLKFIEADRRQKDGAVWILYNVIEPESTQDYGRHYALIVVLGKHEQLICHNFKNISDRPGKPWYPQIEEWWEKHYEEGLVDEQGNPISLETEPCA